MEVMTRPRDTGLLDKESFWKEHQDVLVRIRNDLSSGKKSRSKFSPAAGVRKRTPNGPSPIDKGSNHPPYGKYRRTPSPYHLPKLNHQSEGGNISPARNGISRANKYEIVPPVKPKLAFSKQQNAPEYDSWGEEEDEDDEDEDYTDDQTYPTVHTKKGGNSKLPRYKPRMYPSPVHTYSNVPQIVYGAPFPMYYPPPPRGSKGAKKLHARRHDKHKGYRDIHTARRALAQSSNIPVPTKRNRKLRQSMPMFATPFPMMPMPMMYPPVMEEEEEEDEDDEIELPYDHPLYLPSLYSCEDLLSDHLADLTLDIVRETVAEAANDYMDEKLLRRDPLEDFLNDLLEDAVREGVRETVRGAVVNMAEDYMETEFASLLIDDLLGDHLDEIKEELLDETVFDMIAEDFIDREVIASEVKEESAVIAKEVLDHYDSKILKREFREVSQKAAQKLAESILMSYMMSVVSQQGKIWTENDHYNKLLDDMIFNTSMEQMVTVQRCKDKTLQSKPLYKLHERVVSDVALDVFLQHLTRSLDEDMADVDEWERGVMDAAAAPFPIAAGR